MGRRKAKLTEASPDFKSKRKRLPRVALEIIKQISLHQAVDSNSIKFKSSKPDGSFEISFLIQVVLPTKAYQKGVSATGVKELEPISLLFSAKYPYKAPTILLREDFPLHFPHLNPVKIVDRRKHINPCVLYGKLDEFIWSAQLGILEVLNQLVDWLGKAACGSLIDPEQGWEPIRRDGDSFPFYNVTYDVESLQIYVTPAQGSVALNCGYVSFSFGSENDYAVVAVVYEKKPFTLNTSEIERCLLMQDDHGQDEKRSIGIAPAFFLWGGREIGNYFYDTVNDLPTLIESADGYDCKAELLNHLNSLRILVNQPNVFHGKNIMTLRVFFILCAKRPFKLIGSNSRFEMIPYAADLEFKQKFSPLNGGSHFELSYSSNVYPCSHRHPVTKGMLRQMSEGLTEVADQSIVKIGCGSIGSKIVMHLARAGYGPFELIDNSFFSPHNTARHALLDGSLTPFGIPKVMLLSSELRKMGHKASEESAHFKDIIELLKDNDSHSWRFPVDTALIIESTGSMLVREFLASLPPAKLPGVLMHNIALGSGKAGLIAIEGKGRNPNISDLTARFWDYVIEDDELFKILSADGLARQPVGQGCDSYTMIVPDSLLSLYAAGMAEKARLLLKSGVASGGELFVGRLDDGGIGVSWESVPVLPTVALTDSQNPKWEIRIFKEVVDYIDAESKSWGKIETGGVLLGRISHLRHCINITRVVEAPEDSEQSETMFVLGKKGLKNKLTLLQDRSCGALTYVGTWHSHPKGGGASVLDSTTLARLMELRLGFPAVFIIWTPEQGLLAKVGEYEVIK